MTVGVATFRTIVGILLILLTLFAIKEVIFIIYPLLENMSPDADWWNPFVDISTAKILYPNDYVWAIIFFFWAFTIGVVIGFAHGLLEVAQELE